MTEPLDFRCRSCRLHVHDRCDLIRGCECVVIGVDRSVHPPRIILCPGALDAADAED